MVEIDSNAILVEPMKSRNDEEMVRAYDSLLARLRQTGSMPCKHVLDNEVSDQMKHHIQVTCKLEMELVPPGCHRRNAAEDSKFQNTFPQCHGQSSGGLSRKPMGSVATADRNNTQFIKAIKLHTNGIGIRASQRSLRLQQNATRTNGVCGTST